MQPPDQMQENIELRIRTIRILWLSLFLSVVIYYALTLFVKRPENIETNEILFPVLVAIALPTILISVLVKHKIITRAIDLQRVQLVQQGYIVALALAEVPALLGLLTYFATGNRYYPILFIIAVFGQLLHFPRREHVVNASFR
jgi:uncharacterized membrane protein YiaA